MQTLIVDTLKTWREAERLLKSLPPGDPNHETIRGLVVELRSMYSKLSGSSEQPAETVVGWRKQLDSATDLLAKVHR